MLSRMALGAGLLGVGWASGVAAASEPVVLQTDQVAISCSNDADATCVAVSKLGVAPDVVRSLLLDVDAYPGCFASLQSATRKDGELVTMAVDLPSPLGHSVLDVRVVKTATGVDWIRSTGSVFWRDVSFTVVPDGEGSLLSLRYDAPQWPLPAQLRHNLLRRTGHNLSWGLAMCLNTEPTTVGLQLP